MSNIQLHKDMMMKPAAISRIKDMLGNERKANAFITSVLSAVSQNGLLQKSKPETVLQAAMMAASLDLPINQNLGFAYIVPYKGNAQFQIGYKGLIQLAQRSGQFKTISATPIYEGQLVEENPLEGFKFDFTVKGEKVVGYAGFFRLINGFEKTLYMTVEQIQSHAKQYSQSYGKDYSPWKSDFDAMATKTVLKMLLSKFAPLSTEMQRAVVSDQAVITNSDSLELSYVDNGGANPSPEHDRALQLIASCNSTKDLSELDLPDEYEHAVNERFEQLSEQEGK